MAASCLNIQPFFAKPEAFSRPYPIQLHNATAITTNRHFQLQILSPLPSRSKEFCVRIMPRLRLGNCEPDQHNLANSVGRLIWLFRSFSPGGDWWKLRDSMEVSDRKGKSATVSSALWRIWLLVSDDRWIIISAFASLAIAAGIGALIYLMMLSWPLGLSSLAVCLILAFIFVIYGGYQKEAANFNQELEASANQVARDTFYLVRTVRICGTEDEEVGRYKHWLNKLAFINLRESIAYGLWNLSFNFLYRSTQIIAVVLGGLSISFGNITPEELLKYILYCEWLIYATWRLLDNAASLYQSVGASESIFEMMDLLPSNQFSVEGKKLQHIHGHIELVDVSFFYPTRLQMPVLKHVNITIQAQEVVAIVGLSGSGKSSLIKLLLRLYEPTDGEIKIDGVPISKLDVRWLRDHMGYVGQEPALMHMDVKSNISYGYRGHIRHDDIIAAAKLAYAHEFISSLPNGYDTVVNNNLLSGGQKQRIAIARAILRNPKILILDEPTSALDVESEHCITGVLQGLKADSSARGTVIVIAHRLSTIKVADRIIVMDDGKIVEMGNHEELVKRRGLYSRLAEMQRQV